MWFQNAWHAAGRWCLGQGVRLVLRELGSINHPSVSVQVGSNCSWMQPHASGESSLRAAYVCTLLSPLPAGLLTSGDPLWVWWITGMTHSFLDWVRLAGQGRKHNTAYLRNERWCHFKKNKLGPFGGSVLLYSSSLSLAGLSESQSNVYFINTGMLEFQSHSLVCHFRFLFLNYTGRHTEWICVLYKAAGFCLLAVFYVGTMRTF